MYEYRAKVVEFKDGDTIVVEIFLGFDISTRQTIRVLGINCPEIHSRDEDEKRRGFAALSRAQALAPPGGFVTVRSQKPGAGDKFGRYLASIALRDGRDYSAVLVSEGHAKTWDGQGVKPI